MVELLSTQEPLPDIMALNGHHFIRKCMWTMHQQLCTLYSDRTISVSQYCNGVGYDEILSAPSKCYYINECDYIYDYAPMQIKTDEFIVTAVKSQPVHIWSNGQVVHSLYCKSHIDEHMHPYCLAVDNYDQSIYAGYDHTIVKFDLTEDTREV